MIFSTEAERRCYSDLGCITFKWFLSLSTTTTAGVCFASCFHHKLRFTWLWLNHSERSEKLGILQGYKAMLHKWQNRSDFRRYVLPLDVVSLKNIKKNCHSLHNFLCLKKENPLLFSTVFLLPNILQYWGMFTGCIFSVTSETEPVLQKIKHETGKLSLI